MSDRNCKAWLLTIIIFSLQSFIGCGQSTPEAPESAKEPDSESEGITTEYLIKEKVLAVASDIQADPLTTVRHIECKAGEGKPFVYPHSLAVSEDGQIYISDNNAHKVFCYSPEAKSVTDLISSDSEGSLDWPTIIKVKEKNLFVLDTKGIKVFTLNGSFHYLLRTFYQINDFAIRPGGGLYSNPSFRKQKSSNPLVVELNKDGTKVQSFGSRINREEHIGLEDTAWLCTADNRIFVVFRHRPLVQVFNSSGNFIQSFSINHAIFKELTPLVEDKEYTNPGPSKYRLPGFVAGACVVANRLLVLLDLPQPEVIEFDFDGVEIKRYRGNVTPAARAYHGFDAHIVDNKYQFWMFVRSQSSMLTLLECIGSNMMSKSKQGGTP